MKLNTFSFALFAMVCLSSACGHDGAEFEIVKDEQGITVLEGTRPVLTYQRAVRSKGGKWPRANYVHPIYDLDGEVLTEDFPADHGHHRGVFWAWHQVIIGGQPIGDAWVCEDFEWDVIDAFGSLQEELARVQATTLWKSPQYVSDDGIKVPFVLEHSTITVHPRQAESRFIDFDIRLHALVAGVALGGSDDEKGYGGFSPRFKLTGQEIFLGTQGAVTPLTEQLEVGPWIDISNEQQGVTMLTHPSNPGFPQPWILRRERSMQNAVYPGRESVELPINSPLRLRYRLVVHCGLLEGKKIDELQSEYE